jgi:hypothetical protein
LKHAITPKKERRKRRKKSTTDFKPRKPPQIEISNKTMGVSNNNTQRMADFSKPRNPGPTPHTEPDPTHYDCCVVSLPLFCYAFARG